MANGNDTKFQKAMSSGLVATIGWFALLVIYCTFQALHIDVPAVNNAFPILTGGWVGMLTLAQSAKNRQTADDTEQNKEDVKQLKKVAKKEHPKVAKEELEDE